MIDRAWIAGALVALAGAGCQSKSGSSAGSGSAPGPGDGGAAAVDDGGTPLPGPDEATVRAGKRTGLGSPDELPEVATEELIRALIDGSVRWDRFVDPAAGVVELRAAAAGDGDPAASAEPFLGRRCGAELATTLTGLGPAMAETLARADLDYEVVCDNGGLVVAEPGVARHALCSVTSPADYAPGWDLVLVPDPARGLRLIGVSYTGGADRDELLDRYDDELGRSGAPCK